MKKSDERGITVNTVKTGEISKFSENLELSLGQSSKHPNVVSYLCAGSLHRHKSSHDTVFCSYTLLIQSA